MRELLRTNDHVALSLAMALLKDAGIDCVMFDTHTAIIEGSISAIQKRMMVLDEDHAVAHELLVGAELLDSGDSREPRDRSRDVPR
ncbi:MAG: DUF2007 domain-containing protein [Proteobacteria bacterium]|nr:DUF2007 domain-containing protein [Pseudomonadota bacterium]